MAAVAHDRGGPKVDALYNLMQSFENKLGGGEGVEGLYGSLTQASMQKVLDCFKRNSGLDGRSVFVDIGAGLGRPMLHAMVTAGVTSAWGVELDHVKCEKAGAFCGHVMGHLVRQDIMDESVPVPPVVCSPIEKVKTLDPATHAYSFWEGVPPSGKQAFGELFAASKTLRAVAVVQRAIRGQDPAALMREYGFGPLLLIAHFSVKMSGSGRSFTAYVFTKIAPAAANFIANAAAAGTTAAAAEVRGLPLSGRERQECGEEATAATPAVQQLSPSKARKPDGEAGPASPAKKAAPARRKAEGSDDDAVTEARPLADTRSKAKQQLLLTSLPEYNRRTKQGAAAGKHANGHAAAGKAVASKADGPPAGRTRSSSRLAAKAQAALSAVVSHAGPVEGH